MNQRLCIGLINPSDLLIKIMNSIGVWFETIDVIQELDSYALLVIDGNHEISQQGLGLIQNYRQQGHPLLEISSQPKFYSPEVFKTFRKSIYNQKTDSEFDRITHIDIYSKCCLSKQSKILSGLIDFEREKTNSNLGFIGLNLANLPDQLYTRKRFLSLQNNLPDELTSKLSINSLSKAIELTIQRLFHESNLPFIKKWTSPKMEPVYCFRIDSDYGTKESIAEVYSLLTKNSIKATWFLHVEAHKDWIGYFKDLNDQEIALHGYEHGFSSNFDRIKTNIELGLRKLLKFGIEPSGYCAPYGIWNESLSQALEAFEFKYTSEFTSGYDGVPFYQTKSNNLQIPIHPICTGSLSRKRYSLDQIQNYFLDIYERKKKLFEPIIFYHHPLQIGLEVFENIFRNVNNDQLINLTFNEYADFWNQRLALKFSAVLKNDEIEIESNDSSLFLYISNSATSFDLIPSKTQTISKELNSTFKYDTPSLPSLSELKKLHGNRFSLMKTSLVDWKNRQRL